MEEPNHTSLTRSPAPRLLATLLFGVVGFLINGYPLFILPEVSILFGGAFYLVIASTRGPVHGFTAAAIAGSRALWTPYASPWIFPVFALEGLFVGAFRRRLRSLLLADIVFWVLIAGLIPLTGFGLADQHSHASGWVVAIKNACNGIVNVLLAEFLLLLPSIRRLVGASPGPRANLATALQRAFVLVTVLPIFGMSVLGGRLYQDNERTEALQQLQSSAQSLALAVDAHLHHHQDGIRAFAESIEEGDIDRDRLNELLELHLRSYPSFLSMLVADSDGTIVASSSNVSASGEAAGGTAPSVRESEFLQEALLDEAPYISDVFQGRGVDGEITVAISAPVTASDGRRLGVVEGSLDLGAFGDRIRSFHRGDVVVVDRADRVVFASSSTVYGSLQSIQGSPLLRGARTSEASSFLFDQPRSERHDVEAYAAAVAFVESSGWQVFAVQDAASVFRDLQELYVINVGAALLGLLIALLVAKRMSASVTDPIAGLLTRIRTFRDDTPESAETIPPSPNAPTEVCELRGELDRMGERLREGRERLELALREQDRINALLEDTVKGLDARVKERTAELDRAKRDAEESRERYAELVDGIDVIVWEAETESSAFTFVNKKTEDILGYPQERWLSEDCVWPGIIHPEDRDEAVARCKSATERGENHELEYRMISADGRTVWMRDLVRVIKDDEGRPRLRRGLFVDITENKRAEEEKRALEAQLRQAQKMEAIGQLAGGIAHDFNNLLTVINGYAEVLKHKLRTKDPLRRHADDIFSAGDRAAKLTQQLLAFSRKQVLTPTILDLNRLLTNIESLLKRLIGENIETELRLLDEPCLAKVDESQIQQVVMNLAVNARDAMPRGGKIVLSTTSINAERVADNWPNIRPGPYVRLTVEDTGVGMAPNVVEQVFEPFFTTKPRGAGTGLGLSTVYGIVKQSGGYIWADSEPGRGTRFEVFLPRSSGPLPSEMRANVTHIPSSSRRTVLLVEDDELVRALASEVLEEDGYVVHGAADGRQALNLADELENIDILVTDLVMPHVDGIELTKRITRARPRLRVVVMSGYPDRAHVVNGVGLDEWAFLNKPFTRDKLIGTLRELLSDVGPTMPVH